MIVLLLLYGLVALVGTFSGVGTWFESRGDPTKQGYRRWGARVALLSWAWPLVLLIALVVGLVWLIRQLLSDAFGY